MLGFILAVFMMKICETSFCDRRGVRQRGLGGDLFVTVVWLHGAGGSYLSHVCVWVVI